MSSEIPPHIGERTAPELFGMFFNYGLMGSLVVQVYQYYSAFPKDRKLTKAIVYTVFILELTQTGIMSYFAYTIFGSGFGNVVEFDKSALEWFPVCILGSLIAGIVQLYYAYRLRLFSSSNVASGIVAVLAVIQIGSGIGQGVISKLATERSNLSGKPICVTIWLLSSALCDLMIAASMAFYLKQGSQFIQSAKMKDFITRIVRYTVETGAITAIVAVVQLAVFLAYPNNNFFETPNWTLGKLYSNSLLVLLNARAITIGGRNYEAMSEVFANEINLDSRRRVSGEGGIESHLSSVRFHNNRTGQTHGIIPDPQISKETEVKRYPSSSRTLREPEPSR
ncbi:hypothetical protein C8R43DRAFT_1000866 [Mycena crocata]|nr:hypothetical protein C8R43DRAFT_1000866 [Mycena crocata]